MKDFRLDKKTEKNYIIDYIINEGEASEEGKEEKEETLSIVFADGRVFNHVVSNDENIRKITAQQEKQAKAGVENIEFFKKRKTKAGIMTAASIVGGPIIGAVAAGMLPNPFTVAIGAGVITVAATIPAVCSLVKNSGKVTELNKIKYRDDHRKELDAFKQYPNALVGLSKRKRAWFADSTTPFSITAIDEFSQSDLEQIVANIDTEKAYQFTYSKRPASAEK